MRVRGLLLFLESALALSFAWVLVFVIPFRWTRRLFGCVSSSDDMQSKSITPEQITRARAVTQRLRRVADRLPWHSTCLVRALSGRMLLARRGLRGGVVRFGVKAGADGCVAAHAWLIFGPVTLLGEDEAEGFQPLADLV